MQKHRLMLLLCAVVLAIASRPAASQFPQRPSLPGGLSADDLKALRNLPSLKDLIGGAPLTTSLDDAVSDVAFLDRFDPVSPAPLLELPFGLDDGVTLVPGAWQSPLEGFCLQAGTLGPTRGDGYAWAPLKGPKADVIGAILNGIPRAANVNQEDAQVLLWAILARAKSSSLDEGPRRVAEQLLSKTQLASIDKNALDVLPADLLGKVLGPAAEPVRRVLDAENQMRAVLAEPGAASYQRLEELAVLHDVNIPSPQGRVLPSGRWSLMPNGSFVRYAPDSYAELTLQLYVPEAFTVARDAAGHITDLASAAGASMNFEYAGDTATRMTYLATNSPARAVAVSHPVARNSPAVTGAVAANMRMVATARRQNERAADLTSLTQLALSTDDTIASQLLNRAWASALSDLARPPAATAGPARVVPIGFVRPVVAPQRGSGLFGGGSGGGFGGGSGAGATGGGRQRQGSTLKKPPKDDALSRARRATDKGLGGVGSQVPNGGWGFRIPREVLRGLLDRLYDAYRAASDALEGDPPRQDFRQFSKPLTSAVPDVDAGPDLPAADAVNYATLFRDVSEMNSYLAAGIIAIDRHGGAVQSGDRVWASRQAQALIYLKRQAGLAALRVSADLRRIGPDATRAATELRAFGQHFASLPEVPAPWN